MLASTLAAALLALAPPESGVPPRHVEAVRTREAVVVDGEARDEVWSRAPVATGFVERTPGLGEEPPLYTRVQIAYDDAALYVLVECQSGGPQDEQIRTLRRDSGEVFDGDAVSLKIDPHHDRRSALVFGTNVDGAQVDMMILEDGRVGIREWDAVWQVETSKHEGYYLLEYRLPFAILGLTGRSRSLDAEGALTMGFNVSRDHSRRNATYDWRLITPPRHWASAATFGTLGGIRDIRPQRALEYTPFVLGRTDFTKVATLDPRRVPNGAVGADVRIQVGKASFVEGSFLTDFAQVDVDNVQVASDRFPLFFPERRPFFINGLDVFNFGNPGQGQLFFSRRVGLDAGRPIPILEGVKAYGRSGPVSFGVLNVQTLRSLAHDPGDASFASTPPENFTVARLRAQAGRRLILGALTTGKARIGERGHDVFSWGADAELRSLDGKGRGYAFVAGTYRETPATDAVFDDAGELVEEPREVGAVYGNSAHLLVQYQGLFVRPEILWLWSDDDFQAPLGFYRRPGTGLQRAAIKFAPRPRMLGLRDIEFGPAAQLETSPTYDELLTVNVGSQVQLNWAAGWWLGYEAWTSSDRVQQEFDLYGYTIDADHYLGQRHKVQLGSPGREKYNGRLSYQFAQPFGGQTHTFDALLQGRPSKHFAVQAGYTHVLGYFERRDQSFNFGFLNGNVDVAFTRFLHWDTLVRLSLEPGASRFGVQSRVRWRYRPGSDLFVVYRTDQPFGFDASDPPREPFHEITVKLTYYLRALF